MKVKFHSINFNADVKLLKYIRKKTEKLEVFYDNIISIDVYLKVKSTSFKENKLSEIKLKVTGKDIVVKKVSFSFKNAVDQCIEVLSRSLIRYKSQMSELV